LEKGYSLEAPKEEQNGQHYLTGGALQHDIDPLLSIVELVVSRLSFIVEIRFHRTFVRFK
jgi:hypothetical protein